MNSLSIRPPGFAASAVLIEGPNKQQLTVGPASVAGEGEDGNASSSSSPNSSLGVLDLPVPANQAECTQNNISNAAFITKSRTFSKKRKKASKNSKAGSNGLDNQPQQQSTEDCHVTNGIDNGSCHGAARRFSRRQGPVLPHR